MHAHTPSDTWTWTHAHTSKNKISCLRNLIPLAWPQPTTPLEKNLPNLTFQGDTSPTHPFPLPEQKTGSPPLLKKRKRKGKNVKKNVATFFRSHIPSPKRTPHTICFSADHFDAEGNDVTAPPWRPAHSPTFLARETSWREAARSDQQWWRKARTAF